MTTLYKTVLIETAQQAEELPALTPYVRVYDHEVAGEAHPVTTHAGLIGETEPQDLIFGPPFREFALVTLEAVEEARAFYTSRSGTTIRVPVDDQAREKGRVESRLVTDWEEE